MSSAPEAADRFDGGALWRVDPRGAPLDGAGWPTAIHPDDASPTAAARAAALADARGYRVEYRLGAATPIPVLEWARPRRGPAGEFAGLDGATVELGGATDTIEARRRALATLDTFVQVSPLAVMVMDESSRVQLWNPAAERIFGWSEAEVLGQINPLVPFDRRGEARRIRERVMRGEALSEVEVHRQRKDGTLVALSTCAAPIRGSDGAVRGLVAVLSDITERKRLEDQLRHAQKMDALGRLAAGVAHDFNNLLTAISGFGELALRQVAANHPARRNLEQVRTAAARAAALTQQLLAFSRRQPVAPRIIDLNRVVADLETMLRRLIGETIELTVLPAPAPMFVLADPGQLEQVVVNLVVNARDAMPEGGRLTVAIAPERSGGTDHGQGPAATGLPPSAGEVVVLSVTDTGCGMDAETRSRIFEPFFTTKGEGKGTGLGLATVYGVVHQSRGEVEVVSAPGAGSTFRVVLPRTTAAAAAEAPPAPPAARGTETVLVVEDDDQVRDLATAALYEAGYMPLGAADPAVALSLVEQHAGPIDLLLTDLALPRMTGEALAGALAARRPGLRVLYMSGYGSGGDDGPGDGRPADPFLQKPFTVDALLTRVRACLDAPRAAAA